MRYFVNRKSSFYLPRSWTQPVLTADGVIGGNSFAVSASSVLNSWEGTTNNSRIAFNAFDGVTTDNDETGCWHSDEGFPQWIQFYNPNPLKVSKLTIYNRSYDGAHRNEYGVAYSDDGNTFTEFLSGTSPNQNDGGTFTIVIDQGAHKYWRIIAKSSSGSNSGYATIGEIKIDAQEYVETNKALALLKRTSYFENVGTYKPWSQPVLTANGTVGGSSFAVSASSYHDSPRQPYCAFDGVTTDNGETGCWHSSAGFPQWIQFYNPNPLNISKLTIMNRSASGAYINSYGISYSDNGSNFTEFVTGTSPNQVDGGSFDVAINQGGHKYWRITAYSGSGSNSNYVAIGEIKIKAQELDTSSEYISFLVHRK